MTQTFRLVGGGPGTVIALRRHFKAALDALDRPDPLVAYVGVASNDDRGFYSRLRGLLGASGARIKLAKMASPRASASEARSLLAESDLVFMSGGDVEQGMKILHERDMARVLLALGRSGKPMFGVSAGSLMMGREWVRFPDQDDESTAEIFPCLGLAPVHVDAHSEEDGWSELCILVRLLHERGDTDPVGYGLTGPGGLCVTFDDHGVDVKAMGTPIPRIVVRRGKVVEGKPLPLT
jgi:cyanophycinase-like exopeptidase